MLHYYVLILRSASSNSWPRGLDKAINTVEAMRGNRSATLISKRWEAYLIITGEK
jgi:hypothetical protein